MTALGLEDTHGILRRPGVEMLAASDGLRWSSAFAATQREVPYEESFPAVASHLVILHLDGHTKVDRWIGGRRDSHVVGPGGTFVMPGGVDFRVRLGGRLSTVHLYLRDHVVREVARDLSGHGAGPDLVPRLGERDPLLERLVLGIRDELLDPGLMGDGYVDCLARAAVARLLRTGAGAGGRAASGTGVPGDGRIARAVDYIDAHLHRSVDLAALSAVLGLSVSQTIALFKKTLGMPPHRFIMGRRVARARDLLRHGALPLAEVAAACGFSHQEHMTRVFKRETRSTPGAYRRARA